jgi:fructan beta-fructosidase
MPFRYIASILIVMGIAFVGSTAAADPPTQNNLHREIIIHNRYLLLPIKNKSPLRKLTLSDDGRAVVKLDVELADATPDWWAFIDVSPWQGKTLSIQVDTLTINSSALKNIEQGDALKDAENLYRESLRPQFHFSSRRGWNNDPNGLVYYRGEYHLFYQHNPVGWDWGNMHWGHAVSRDLVHWQELGDVLWPNELGPAWSGSAVVDWKNTSALGRNGQPPQALLYTAAGKPFTQCLVGSTDGRTYTLFDGNPVVKEIAKDNRDPKVFWHEPTAQWVMVLYVGLPGKKSTTGAPSNPTPVHTIHFLTSPDLKTWTIQSHIPGFYECPDFFELPINGRAANKKWVLTAANSDYMVGSFDGKTFRPETKILKGQLGKGFYAAQTFSDIPADDGRRIQIGWLQFPSPGMSFNQCMSVPLELKLVSTPDGPRMTWTPVKELEALRKTTHRLEPFTLKSNADNPLADMKAELVELRAEFTPGDAEVVFNVRGAALAYDGKQQQIVVNGHRASAPLRDGKQRLVVYCDRTGLEIFAADGKTYVPMPYIPKAEDLSLGVSVKDGKAKFLSLDVYELKSIWK